MYPSDEVSHFHEQRRQLTKQVDSRYITGEKVSSLSIPDLWDVPVQPNRPILPAKDPLTINNFIVFGLFCKR